jgi:hypothetical protein
MRSIIASESLMHPPAFGSEHATLNDFPRALQALSTCSHRYGRDFNKQDYVDGLMLFLCAVIWSWVYSAWQQPGNELLSPNIESVNVR